jgi:hypothetical protein
MSDDPRDGPPPANPSLLRPYLLTGGRARSNAGLEMEAQVATTEAGQAALNLHRYEHREILVLCQQPMAVVEVAAHLDLHFVVARVLVGDLVEWGHLSVRRMETGQHRNAQIIERVIRGIQALY